MKLHTFFITAKHFLKLFDNQLFIQFFKVNRLRHSKKSILKLSKILRLL